MNISNRKVKKISEQATNDKKITQNIALFSDKIASKTPKIVHSHQILPVSTKNHQSWPTISNSLPTWTINMVLSHFMHQLCHSLWGLRMREVLKSSLHCICKIFISSGNSSVLEYAIKSIGGWWWWWWQWWIVQFEHKGGKR